MVIYYRFLPKTDTDDKMFILMQGRSLSKTTPLLHSFSQLLDLTRLPSAHEIIARPLTSNLKFPVFNLCITIIYIHYGYYI